MALTEAARISCGLLLTIFAGILNGSWNAAFHPQLDLAVAPDHPNNNTDDDDDDLEYHHAFGLFQIYAALVNVAVCLLWAGGPSHVGTTLRLAEPTDVGLVALFGFLWGLGSLGFGLACRVAGVGLGTNLTMGVIVIGVTFLPLCYDGVIREATGWVILAGLAICCVGLFYSMRSLKARDADEQQAATQQQPATSTAVATPPTSSEGDAEQVASSTHDDETEEASRNAIKETEPSQSQSQQPQPQHTSFQKVAICLIAGALATQLQFAFVFGQDIIDIADDSNNNNNSPAGGAAATIWLLAISIGAPPIVAYMLYHSPQPVSNLWTSLWFHPRRHVKLVLTTVLPWVAHIHLYGLVSNVLLPKRTGASIAWPLLMSECVVVCVCVCVVSCNIRIF